MVYKRPAITESKERGMINLEPITANLDPYVDTDGKNKTHFKRSAT